MGIIKKNSDEHLRSLKNAYDSQPSGVYKKKIILILKEVNSLKVKSFLKKKKINNDLSEKEYLERIFNGATHTWEGKFNNFDFLEIRNKLLYLKIQGQTAKFIAVQAGVHRNVIDNLLSGILLPSLRKVDKVNEFLKNVEIKIDTMD